MSKKHQKPRKEPKNQNNNNTILEDEFTAEYKSCSLNHDTNIQLTLDYDISSNKSEYINIEYLKSICEEKNIDFADILEEIKKYK